MTPKERAGKIIAVFEKQNPDAATELVYTNPFELLVSVILSAQCTDKRVNHVTPGLFAKYPTSFSMAKATSDELFPFIRSISYPNNKAKHLAGMARMLVEKHQGEVPGEIEQLKMLPGVGQKTANVIASVIFNTPAMPVDTHVFRVSARIGLTRNAKTPEQAEKQLVRIIPREKLSVAHHWLILHGRYVCKARKPLCGSCYINQYCKYVEKNNY